MATASSPTELKQSVYEYSFTPVNLKDIKAFALPGGPMFVQRGMFEAAAEEAEVAGAKSKRVNSAQQDRNLVPNGAVLVHQL